MSRRTLPPLIPDSAPFSKEQRAWLNGFFAGLYCAPPPGPVAAAEEFPWHDPALDLAERLNLAAGRPLARRLMAAMAQLDCGQCGYLCRTYAEALAEGRETTPSLCVPGAKPTARAVRAMLAENPAPAAVAAPAPAAPPGAPVRVLSAEQLTGPGSAKDVRHVVIDLEGSDLAYQPGDSLSLEVRSDPALVAATLAALNATGNELFDGQRLAEVLARLDIARPLEPTVRLLAATASDREQAAAVRRLAEGEDGAEPDKADLLDLLESFPSARPPLADLVRSLPPVRRRLYSIASSPRAHPGKIHLCVSVVQDVRRGRRRAGVGSSFLAHHAATAGPLQANIQDSHFRLPADPRTNIVMVGPGTGIAPFRAFLAERAALGIRGHTWLFFGDQHRASDFLYGPQLQAWLDDGTLSRLDLAFSRDQPAKLYVQHKMLEHAAELWRWLQHGAVYVCGDATRMARDVDAALRQIAATEGGLTHDQARDWLATLARDGRYLRDIY